MTAALLDLETRGGVLVEGQSHNLVYEPAILGMGRVHFVDRRKKVDEQEDFALLTQPPSGTGVLQWEQAQPLDLTPRDLMNRPEPDAYFDQLPKTVNEAREFNALKKDLADHLYRNSSVTLLYSPVLRAYSRPKETERDFRMRLSQAAREERDEEVDKLNRKYEKRLRRLEDQVRRAEATLAKKRADAEGRKARGPGLRWGVGARDVHGPAFHAGGFLGHGPVSPESHGQYERGRSRGEGGSAAAGGRGAGRGTAGAGRGYC